MRILTVDPGFQFSVADCHNGWTRAFRALGHEVQSLSLTDRIAFYSSAHVPTDHGFEKVCTESEGIYNAAKGLEIACYEYWPDLVFITSGFFVPQFILKVIRDRGHKLVILHTEEPYELDRELAVAPYASVNLINDPTHLERFREVAPSEYQWHCYDEAIHRPVPAEPELRSDFAFCGTGFQSRIDFFEKVDWTGIDASFAGTWAGTVDGSPLRDFLVHDIHQSLDNADAVRLYGSTKMSANLYRVESHRPELSEGWSLGPREVELAACGVPFLRQRRGEGDEVLGFLPTFDTPVDFTEQLRFYLDRPDARERLATQAREALADRTFLNSARRLLDRL